MDIGSAGMAGMVTQQDRMQQQAAGVDALGEAQAKPIGPEQLKKFTEILRKYKAGKTHTDARIIAAEQWWKLQNAEEERKKTEIGADKGFTSSSAWLHNVVHSKHADAVESYPEPNILPKEPGDQDEARMLRSIIPVVLEQAHFKKTYRDAMWSKMKFGAAAYKVVWDKDISNGLGDIRVDKINLLNLYWQPGVEQLEQSRYIFQTEPVDKEVLRAQYPELENGLKSTGLISARFLYDDAVDMSDKATVIEVYYKVRKGGKTLLHYCKYVEDYVIYATENETQGVYDEYGGTISEPLAETGLYDHGQYPFVMDSLFPVEGSPCGYGYIDLCLGAQTEIDLLNTAFIKNAIVGALPRYMSNNDEAVFNESELLDTKNPIVHIKGSLDEINLKLIQHNPIDSNYLNLLDRCIQEMRETSGNTETSNGNISSGVTAASAIAALQEASGKGSRDSTQQSYIAYEQICKLVIELIRQFYDLPRQFRITGEYGQAQFVSYSNKGLSEPLQGLNGEVSYRKPEFDIEVHAQKQSAYTKQTNNELALQLYQLGCFNTQQAEQTLMLLDMMDFDGKDILCQKLQKAAQRDQALAYYIQQAYALAAQDGNAQLAQQAAADMQQLGIQFATVPGGGSAQTAAGTAADAESGVTVRARAQAAQAAVPQGG